MLTLKTALIFGGTLLLMVKGYRVTAQELEYRSRALDPFDVGCSGASSPRGMGNRSPSDPDPSATGIVLAPCRSVLSISNSLLPNNSLLPHDRSQLRRPSASPSTCLPNNSLLPHDRSQLRRPSAPHASVSPRATADGPSLLGSGRARQGTLVVNSIVVDKREVTSRENTSGEITQLPSSGLESSIPSASILLLSQPRSLARPRRAHASSTVQQQEKVTHGDI
eukprot:Hpha_TRINITY_DN5453_c0_g1::TRINITY_DN5453_c0_g1_i1::g.192507::m.192507